MNKAIEIIKRFEGICDGNPKTVNLDPYVDPIGLWTIGWGHLITTGEGKPCRKGVGFNDYHVQNLFPEGITLAVAEKMLEVDVLEVQQEFKAWLGYYMTPKYPTPNELAALTSFIFNIGMAKFKANAISGLVLGYYRNKYSANQVADRMQKYVYADGKILPGLVRRRAQEASLFTSV
jgi:lysozyme